MMSYPRSTSTATSRRARDAAAAVPPPQVDAEWAARCSARPYTLSHASNTIQIGAFYFVFTISSCPRIVERFAECWLNNTAPLRVPKYNKVRTPSFPVRAAHPASGHWATPLPCPRAAPPRVQYLSAALGTPRFEPANHTRWASASCERRMWCTSPRQGPCVVGPMCIC